MKKDIKIFLNDILQSVYQIEKYNQGLAKNDFFGNLQLQDAIFRRLEIIGEAARYIPNSDRKKYPEIPWQEIIGTRDKLIHGYFGVDLDLVWEIIERDLPDLKKKIKDIIEKI